MLRLYLLAFAFLWSLLPGGMACAGSKRLHVAACAQFPRYGYAYGAHVLGRSWSGYGCVFGKAVTSPYGSALYCDVSGWP